jgi:radical SAM protein with 4Fe4S-binding SPASM domain
MTYKCNHACLFCSCPWFNDNGGIEIEKELTLDEWKKYIEHLCGLGICNIAFTGGEPLLKNGILELIGFAASCSSQHIESKDGVLVSRNAPPNLFLLTNGKILTKEVLEICKKHSVNLSISLPGLKTFKYHTVNGSKENVLYWFSEAARIGVKTTAGITVTKKNIGELFETVSEALLAGADTVLLNRFMPGGRGIRYMEELLLTSEDIIKMLDITEEVLAISNRKGSVGTELPKCIADPVKYKHLQVGTRCSAALEFFVIGPSGYIRVCNHSPVQLNHVSDIMALKGNSYWRRFVMKEYLPGACTACLANTSCDGGCREAAHIFRGCVDSIDPLLSEKEIEDYIDNKKKPVTL